MNIYLLIITTDNLQKIKLLTYLFYLSYFFNFSANYINFEFRRMKIINKSRLNNMTTENTFFNLYKYIIFLLK
jgi:hypothetical protein